MLFQDEQINNNYGRITCKSSGVFCLAVVALVIKCVSLHSSSLFDPQNILLSCQERKGEKREIVDCIFVPFSNALG